MGGLALKHLGVQRISAENYYELADRVQRTFYGLFLFTPLLVRAYHRKEDFGDCDMIIASSVLPEDWRTTLSHAFNSKGMVKNGDVTSIEIEGVQFDFISVPKDKMLLADIYFAYNDLGNLMGRVAHKMGFKYGHLGFQRVLRDGDHVFAVIDVAEDPAEIFSFLDYNYSRFVEGFETLEDIFKYTASSRFFNADIYLLHNRNAISRVRDAKRKTYAEFLKWCEAQSELPNYEWPADREGGDSFKEYHLLRAFKWWPKFREAYELAIAKYEEHLLFKTKWNGNLVREWTGLTGKPLGEFMARVNSDAHFYSAYKSDTLQQLCNLVLQGK